MPHSPSKTSQKRFLKIYHEDPRARAPEQPETAQPETAGQMTALLKAFTKATGWSIRSREGSLPAPKKGRIFLPIEGGLAPEYLELTKGRRKRDPAKQVVDEPIARNLAEAIAGVAGQLALTCQALRQREAELAVEAPFVVQPSNPRHLSVRLEAALRGGAEAIGAQAAGLYLMDDAATELKLRSCWGLPEDRLAQPARPLPGALADLEAMLGHAVVLEDPVLSTHWNPPEHFDSAVCVPVSTASTVLGTLWIFSTRSRDFSEAQTQVLEIVAGRVAGELERECLLDEGIDGVELKQQLAKAHRVQRHQLPTIPPLVDGWDAAGWTEQAGTVGGDFFDWFAAADGSIAATVGDIGDGGIAAALSASLVRSAARAHGQHVVPADTLLQQVNLALWTGSAGDEHGDLFCGLLSARDGQVRFARAGRMSVVQIRRDGWTSLTRSTPPLGTSAESRYRAEQCILGPDEALVVFTEGYSEAEDSHGGTLGEAALAEPLREHLSSPASEMVARLRESFPPSVAGSEQRDRSLLIFKRTK